MIPLLLDEDCPRALEKLLKIEPHPDGPRFQVRS